MEITEGKKVSSVTPEELLGPLNDVEQRFAPRLLHVTGDVKHPLPRPRVAIVGSRTASEEGLRAAAQISDLLVRNGVVVVSGLARGIDTAAHKAAIASGGLTVAVLGTPLNRAYPAENYQLQDRIMRDFWAVSQFPYGHRTVPKDFILRNRTMALVSNASIIVEAGESSGSLAQGWEAIRLGRPLYIWKAIFEKKALEWPRKMVEHGAVQLHNPRSVLDYLPPRDSVITVAT